MTQQQGDSGQQIHPETRDPVGFMRLVAGCQCNLLGFSVQFRQYVHDVVLRRDGFPDNQVFGLMGVVGADQFDDLLLDRLGVTDQLPLHDDQFMLPLVQGQVQERPPCRDKLRAFLVELHEQFVTFEGVVYLGEHEHDQGSLTRGNHHCLGEILLAHVYVDDLVEVLRGHPQLLQANGGDKQNQQQLDDESGKQHAPPGCGTGGTSRRPGWGGVRVVVHAECSNRCLPD